MKRYLIVTIFLTSYFFASNNITCLVPNVLYNKIATIFKAPILYNKTNITTKKYKSTGDAIKKIVNSEAKCAIVRSDILYRIKNKYLYQDNNTTQGYIVLSRLPYTAKLYLVRPSVYNDINLRNLMGMTVSVDRITEDNVWALKALLGSAKSHKIRYVSIPFTKSLKKMDKNEIDAYFGFLDESQENDLYHFQSHFTNSETNAINKEHLYLLDFNSIKVPYFIVTSKNTTDKEIEALLYRLAEKDLLTPITNKRYGKADSYLPLHLEQVKLALNERYKKESDAHADGYRSSIISSVCMTYHYGFLKLLRQKPLLKKRLGHSMNRRAKAVFYRLDNILVKIDAHKYECDLAYLKRQKKQFSDLSKQL